MVDREKIREDVDRILARFARILESVPLSPVWDCEADRETRDGTPRVKKAFRERFLRNAPHDEEGFVLAERKDWA